MCASIYREAEGGFHFFSVLGKKEWIARKPSPEGNTMPWLERTERLSLRCDLVHFLYA